MGRHTQITSRASTVLARFFCAAWLAGPAMAQDAAPSAEKITEMSERAIRIIMGGRAEETAESIDMLNDAVDMRDYPLLAEYAPRLAKAYYRFHQEEYASTIALASAVAAALEARGQSVHPYYHQARLLMGSAMGFTGNVPEADLILRQTIGAVRTDPAMAKETELALFSLAWLATTMRFADEADLRADFLNSYQGLGLVKHNDVLQLMFYDVQYRQKRGVDAAQLVDHMAYIRQLADQVETAPETLKLHYRGYQGYLEAHAGRFAEAEANLRAYYDHLRESGLYARDTWENVLFLGAVLAHVHGPQAGYAFFEQELPVLRDHGAGGWWISQLHREMGHQSAAMGHNDSAQYHYRAAYAAARADYRANAKLVISLRGFVDTGHPGLSGDPFEAEIRALTSAALDLAPDAQPLLRLFASGHYTAADQILGQMAQGPDGQTPLFHVNAALFHALMGLRDEALSRAAQLRAASDDPHFRGMADLAEILATVWSTQAETDTLDAAFQRLAQREAELAPAFRRLTRALSFLHRHNHGPMPGVQDDLRAWYAGDRPEPTNLWDLVAEVTMLEVAYGRLDEAEADAHHAALRHRLDEAGGLSVLADYADLVRMMNSPKAGWAEDAISQAGAIAARMDTDVPATHAFRRIAFFVLANAHSRNGDTTSALDWMRRATEAIARDPYARRKEVAFMLSMQAQLLLDLRQPSDALVLARQAFDIVGEEDGVNDAFGTVLQTYVNALWDSGGRMEDLSAFIGDQLSDPALYAALHPFDRVGLISTKARVESFFAPPGEVIATLDTALAEADKSPHLDWRAYESNIHWTRANVFQGAGDTAAGFSEMVASNDLFTAWRQSLIDSGAGQGNAVEDYGRRASWEAALGWTLAQSLPSEAAQ